MSLALVQNWKGTQATGSPVSSIAITFTSAVTAGDVIVVALGNYNPGTITVSDSANSTNYTQRASNGGSNVQSAIFTFVAPIGGASFVVTASFTIPCYPTMAIAEFSVTAGLEITLDSDEAASGSSNAPATSQLAVTGTDLIIAVVAYGESQTVTGGAGFTLGYQGNYTASEAEGMAVQHLLNETSDITPSFGLSASGGWEMTAIALKAAGSPILLNPRITKWGWVAIGATNPSGSAISIITSLSGIPTIYVGGVEATLGAVVWNDTTLDSPWLLCQVTSPAITAESVVTYTIPANCLTTALGGNFAISSQATVANYFGQNEPGLGQVPAFGLTPTMSVGYNLGGPASVQYATTTVAANLRYRMAFVQGNPSTITYSETDPTLPVSWNSGTPITASLFNFFNSNGIEAGAAIAGGSGSTVGVIGGNATITFTNSQTLTAADVLTFGGDSSGGTYNVTDPGTGTVFTLTPVYGGSTNIATTCTLAGQVGYPVPTGQYEFQWDDANAGTSGESQLILQGNAKTCTGIDTTFPAVGHSSANGVRTINGNTITITYPSVLYKSSPNLAHGYNMDLGVAFQNSSNRWGDGTITNFIAVGPGDTIAAVQANPLATAAWLIKASTSPNGNGPAVIRFGEQFCPAGYGNYQQPADLPNVNAFSWCLSPLTLPTIGLASVQAYNTSSSPLVYSNRFGYDTDYDSTGNTVGILDLASHGGGSDNGQWLDIFPGALSSLAALEFTTTAPHGLRTGDAVTFQLGSASILHILPVTGGLTTSLPTVQVSNGSGSITFNSAVPLVNSQGVIFGSDSTGAAYLIGGAPTGTVRVTSGSTAITFAVSTTLTTSESIVFSEDATGTVYTIVTGGTGTVFALNTNYVGTSSGGSGYGIPQTAYTISPNYFGSPSSTSTCNMTATVNIGNMLQAVAVTSATKFALVCANANGWSTDAVQGLVGGPITLTSGYTCVPQNTFGYNPVGLYAAVTANWPGCRLLIQVQPYMSDSCIQYLIDEAASRMLADSEIMLELCDEVWNKGEDFLGGNAVTPYGNVQAYVPAGQVVNSHYTTPGTPVAVTADFSYVLLLGHMVDVAQAQANTHNKGIKVTLAAGCQFTDAAWTNLKINAANALNVPINYIMQGTYLNDQGGNVTWDEACASSGTNPGELPVALMCDAIRYYLFYSPVIWAFYSDNYTFIQNYTVTATKPPLIGYEGGMFFADPNERTALSPGPTGGNSLSHDVFFHPAYYDLWKAACYSMQTGNPGVPGSGQTMETLYAMVCMWGESANLSALWVQYPSMSMVAGYGLSNIGTTDQFTGVTSSGNNLCNDISNESVAGQALLDWIQAANTFTPTPTPTPPPTPTPTPSGWTPPQPAWSVPQLTETPPQLRWMPPQKRLG